MIVPLYCVNEWACTKTRQGFLFKHPDRASIMVRFGDYPGQLFVQRGVLRRVLRLNPKVYDPPEYYGLADGGYQGGDGIDIYPKWTRTTLAKLDGTIRRHHIGHFTEAGTPTAPWPGARYPLAARPHGDGYQDIDGAHLIRAYSHAVAAWSYARDPVARMWSILCANQVMRRFPLVPFLDAEGPEYSLATMWRNVTTTPHQGALGVQRENAWALRCVVESQRAAPHPTQATWIRTFIDMLYIGQAESGATERHDRNSNLQQGEPWGMFGLADDVEVCTGWQWQFMAVAVREAMRVVPETYAHGRVVLERFKAMLDSAPRVHGDVYDGIPTAPGLPRYLVVARGGLLVPRVTEGVGPARAAYDGYAVKAFQEVGLL